MDLGGASQTTGHQPSHNEQTVKYMNRLSQEVQTYYSYLFTRYGITIPFRRMQTVNTSREADPYNICLYPAEIRSLCRPTSKSAGRYVHANV